MKAVFDDIPDDPLGRFDFLRWFAEALFELSLPDISSASKDFEHELDLQLPVAIKEWLLFCEQLKRSYAGFDVEFAFFDFTPRVLPAENYLLLAQLGDSQRWGVDLGKLDLNDPPVEVYHYVASKRGFVPRKSYRVSHVTTWVVELLYAYATGAYSYMQGALDSPTAFVNELKEHCLVSNRIGNLYFCGGSEWYAVIQCGNSGFGQAKIITLNSKQTVDESSIPKMIRDVVGYFRPE